MIEYLGQPGIGLVMPVEEPDYVRVANDLRTKIRTVGKLTLRELAWVLAGGARLPTKAQLMEIYDVRQNAIDAAMIVLRTEGYVVGRQGKGVFVAHGKDDLRST